MNGGYVMQKVMVSYDEFLQLPTEEQKKLLTSYRNEMTNEQILKSWKIGANTLYKYVRQLKLPTAPRTPRMGVSNKKRKLEAKIPMESYMDEEQPNLVPVIVEAEPEPEGFGFSVIGKHSTDTLIKRLEKLALILSDEESEFDVNIRIKEIVQLKD